MNTYIPLAERLRPVDLSDYVGQHHLLADGKPLRRALEEGHPHSMLFWGPPGTGKTTLARMIAGYWQAEFMTLSAVLSGVKDIREAVAQAEKIRVESGKPTVLFVDEVHRFNKAQQDAFLPHIESGVLIFIGATTENPSFELNNALLSRVRTYVLKSLTEQDLAALLQHALSDGANGLGQRRLNLSDEAQAALLRMADGDARRLLNALEVVSDLAADGDTIEAQTIIDIAKDSPRRFDKGGDAFYDQISALHKSVRGSDPDAALYWFCRMLDGGCDPHYIARRVVRMAVEDIALADPRALTIALQGWETYERLGSPEGELALAQAVVYLAIAAKSNAAYMGYKQAMRAAKESGSLDVPLHLRNAVTGLMKDLDYGKGYRYAHNEADGFAAGETYLPDPLLGEVFYEPVPRGLEIKIGEKLKQLRAANQSKTNET